MRDIGIEKIWREKAEVFGCEGEGLESPGF